VTPTERHARNLARVAELEAEGRLFEPYLALIRGVIERHAPDTGFYEDHPEVPHCAWCTDPAFTPWPCADYLAAENALGVE
jgi:hypothetical protein